MTLPRVRDVDPALGTPRALCDKVDHEVNDCWLLQRARNTIRDGSEERNTRGRSRQHSGSFNGRNRNFQRTQANHHPQNYRPHNNQFYSGAPQSQGHTLNNQVYSGTPQPQRHAWNNNQLYGGSPRHNSGQNQWRQDNGRDSHSTGETRFPHNYKEMMVF